MYRHTNMCRYIYIYIDIGCQGFAVFSMTHVLVLVLLPRSSEPSDLAACLQECTKAVQSLAGWWFLGTGLSFIPIGLFP